MRRFTRSKRSEILARRLRPCDDRALVWIAHIAEKIVKFKPPGLQKYLDSRDEAGTARGGGKGESDPEQTVCVRYWYAQETLCCGRG